LNAPSVRAQSGARPHFEVASIRPCEPPVGRGGPKSANGGPGRAGIPTPGRVNVCTSVRALINQAYFMFAEGHSGALASGQLSFFQIEGGPSWINSTQYQINATAEDDHASVATMRGPMMQTLLEDRFKLKVHYKSREVPAYALVVAKGGPKMKPFKEGSCVPAYSLPPAAPLPPDPCPPLVREGKGPNRTGSWPGMSLDEFSSQYLSTILDRPVIDKTGIAGRFDLVLEYAPDDATPGPNRADAGPDNPTGGTSIFTALQEQLGLKLEPAKGSREFLIIDHVERPSEN
jgi:uncharacterized protein (TIGR03435 family)